jgi:hypothetical protein
MAKSRRVLRAWHLCIMKRISLSQEPAIWKLRPLV